MKTIAIGLLLGGVMELGGALALYLLSEKMTRKREDVRRRWRQVKATILSSRLEGATGENSGVLYSPKISFQYDVEGKQYQSETVAIFPMSGNEPGPHQKVVDQFPKGRETDAWVNPGNPMEAVLLRDAEVPRALKLAIWVVSASGTATFLAGAGMLAYRLLA